MVGPLGQEGKRGQPTPHAHTTLFSVYAALSSHRPECHTHMASLPPSHTHTHTQTQHTYS
jgi:hypothetical protein